MRGTHLISLLLTLATASAVHAAVPVTQREVDQAFVRAQRAVAASLKISPGPMRVSGTTTAADRRYLIDRFFNFYLWVQPRFTRKPARSEVRINFSGLDSVRQSRLRTLATFQLFSPDSPIVTGRGATYTTREFGTMLGTFMARMSDLASPNKEPFTVEPDDLGLPR